MFFCVFGTFVNYVAGSRSDYSYCMSSAHVLGCLFLCFSYVYIFSFCAGVVFGASKLFCAQNEAGVISKGIFILFYQQKTDFSINGMNFKRSWLNLYTTNEIYYKIPTV